MSKYINGVDISNDNGSVDFKMLKEKNIEIIYIQATNGMNLFNFKNIYGENESYLDSYYNAAKMYAFKIGLYHFAIYSNESTAADQANRFCDVIKDYDNDCVLMLDIEETGGFPVDNPEIIKTWAREFINICDKRLNQRIGIYSSLSFSNLNYDSSFSQYPLWSASWLNESENRIILGDNENYIGNLEHWNSWTGWQWGVDTNAYNFSENGQIDLDVFTEDIYLTELNNSDDIFIPINTGIPNISNAGICGTNPTYPCNAVVIGEKVYIDGTNNSHFTSKGDKITILNVECYEDKTLIQYPDQYNGVYRQGWVNTDELNSNIEYLYHCKWKDEYEEGINPVFSNGHNSKTTINVNTPITYLYTIPGELNPELSDESFVCILFNTEYGSGVESAYVNLDSGKLI